MAFRRLAARPHRLPGPRELRHECGVTLGKTYPQPLVDHAKGRERALAAYANIRKG